MNFFSIFDQCLGVYQNLGGSSTWMQVDTFLTIFHFLISSCLVKEIKTPKKTRWFQLKNSLLITHSLVKIYNTHNNPDICVTLKHFLSNTWFFIYYWLNKPGFKQSMLQNSRNWLEKSEQQNVSGKIEWQNLNCKIWVTNLGGGETGSMYMQS